jgi:hypothetical protein
MRRGKALAALMKAGRGYRVSRLALTLVAKLGEVPMRAPVATEIAQLVAGLVGQREDVPTECAVAEDRAGGGSRHAATLLRQTFPPKTLAYSSPASLTDWFRVWPR